MPQLMHVAWQRHPFLPELHHPVLGIYQSVRVRHTAMARRDILPGQESILSTSLLRVAGGDASQQQDVLSLRPRMAQKGTRAKRIDQPGGRDPQDVRGVIRTYLREV
jgi:hypothetical protein